MQKDLFWGGLIVGSSWINAIYLTNMRRLTNDRDRKNKDRNSSTLCIYITWSVKNLTRFAYLCGYFQSTR